MLVGIEKLECVIGLALYSAYLADEKPASVLLVSDRPEAGKTELVKAYNENIKVAYMTDITAVGIWRDFHRRIERGEINHFLFPDFLIVLSRRREVVESLIATMNALIEEGIAEVHTGFLKSIQIKSPRPIGIIACTVKGCLDTRRKDWLKNGFLSRLLVVTYKYSPKLVDRIMRSIVEQQYLQSAKITLRFPPQPVRVEIAHDLAEKGRDLAERILEQEIKKGNVYGFRMAKNIIRLMKASALREGRDMVEERDYDLVKDLSHYFNEDYNEV